MSVFSTEADVGDISIARSMYGDEVRISQEDSAIYIPKDKIKHVNVFSCLKEIIQLKGNDCMTSILEGLC